jgi:hypothetical protein
MQNKFNLKKYYINHLRYFRKLKKDPIRQGLLLFFICRYVVFTGIGLFILLVIQLILTEREVAMFLQIHGAHSIK